MTETTTPAKKSVPLWAQIAIWAFLAGLLILVRFGLSRASNPMAEIGQPVPDFDLVYFEGYEYNGAAEMKLSDLRGKIVVINIWASWCKPCEQEAPELEEAWGLYKERGDVVFIGVDYVDTPEGAFGYLKKFGITFPNAPDLESAISSILNRQMGVPETNSGVCRQRGIGEKWDWVLSFFSWRSSSSSASIYTRRSCPSRANFPPMKCTRLRR
ncbi:MAG: TlpA family protein disulfide reductase [Anaerolineales bacterium]|nr:TlpA family protein disulfide reductase [Anaerolineales bacterium]